MEKPNLVLLVDDDEISNFINETILKVNHKPTFQHTSPYPLNWSKHKI